MIFDGILFLFNELYDFYPQALAIKINIPSQIMRDSFYQMFYHIFC